MDVLEIVTIIILLYSNSMVLSYILLLSYSLKTIVVSVIFYNDPK